MTATRAVESSGRVLAAASVPGWQDLALVVMGILLLVLARLFVQRRRRAEAKPAPRVPLIKVAAPAPDGPASPEELVTRHGPVAERSALDPVAERSARNPVAERSARNPVAERTAPDRVVPDSAVAERSQSEQAVPEPEQPAQPVRAGLVRFHLPPEGTLQLLPGRLDIVSGNERVDSIRFIKVPGKEPMITFGRSQGEPHTHIELQSPTVSRIHAAMRFHQGGWQIVNLSTTNPVVVGGKPLMVNQPPLRLEDGDQVEMGEVIFRFHGPSVARRAEQVTDAAPVEIPAPVREANVEAARPVTAPELSGRPVGDVAASAEPVRVAATASRPKVVAVEAPAVAAAVAESPPEAKVKVVAPRRSWAAGALRRPTRPVVRRVDGLTEREIEIARLVADRKSNRAIGELLEISPRTVSTHLTHIFRKCDVTTRRELADYMNRHGIGERAATPLTRDAS